MISVKKDGRFWDVVVSRSKGELPLLPVWLVRRDNVTKVRHRDLLCQLNQSRRLGWTVVVAGEVRGVRLVRGFRTRWQALDYAISIREDLNIEPKEQSHDA